MEKANTLSTPVFFSINGPDNIGKTTQMDMIPSRWGINRMSGIHNYDTSLSEMSKNNSLKSWWFGTDNEDFVRGIFRGLKQRREAAVKLSSHAAFDRGGIMFRAVCTARIAQHDGADIETARKTFEKLADGIGEAWPTETIRILLRHDKDLENTVALALREEEKDDTYRSYQILLHRALAQQVNSGDYTVVIDRGEKTCLQVHQEICEALHAGGVSHSWTPLLQNVKCIVGFGGLSEAGKSTVATETIANFGAQAVRLKIVYLMQSAARESGTNVSDLPDERQAVHLIQQLDLFAHAHYWLKIISIESLHGFTMTSQLQHLIAGKVMIVYLDTEEKKRFERVDIQLREFLEKDKVKKARGAHRIKEIADVVVDNNGTFQDTVDRVTLAVRAYLT